MPRFRVNPTLDETPSANPRALILAAQARDQASALALMVATYAALERLIVHAPPEDVDGHSIVRADLGALLRALNGEMERQVDALVRHTSVLHSLVAREAGLR